MAIWHMQCPECGAQKRLLAEKPCFTCACGVEMKRSGSGPSLSVKEVLDNGAMAKQVERFANAEELIKERVKKADALAGGSASERNFKDYLKENKKGED